MMSLDEAKTLVEIIKNLVETTAVTVGGVWAYYRFVRQREAHPHIQFDVDVIFVVRQGNQWLVELQAQIENKGKVQHRISNLSFDLRCLSTTDAIVDGDENINYQVDLSRLVKKGSWIPSSWDWTFIEPGTTQRYSFIAALPSDATCALLHSRFKYAGEGEFHTADRFVRVPVVDVGAGSNLADDGAGGREDNPANRRKEPEAA